MKIFITLFILVKNAFTSSCMCVYRKSSMNFKIKITNISAKIV